MGVDTKAILRKGTTIQEIEKALSEKYSDVEVHKSYCNTFFHISFKEEGNKRSLAVSFTDSCERDDGIAGVWTSLSKWGNSIEIARYLCETFGGYLDEDDCDDEGFYPINFHLYAQGKEFTNLDLFRHEVISKLGYDNLKVVEELFNKFKNL